MSKPETKAAAQSIDGIDVSDLIAGAGLHRYATFLPQEERAEFTRAVERECWLYCRDCAIAPYKRRGDIAKLAKKIDQLSSELSGELRELTSTDHPAIANLFGDFANLPIKADWPGAPTGYRAPLVRLLEQLSRRARLLATALPADKGGGGIGAYAIFASRLARLHCTARRSSLTPTAEPPIFGFIANVTAALVAIAPELRAAGLTLDLPEGKDNDEAVRGRLRTLDRHLARQDITA